MRSSPGARSLLLLLAVGVAGFPASVLAQGNAPKDAPASAPKAVTLSTVEGRVVGVEDGKLVVDLGSRAGVAAGAVAELWRPLKLRNPATGRTVEDRYRTGTLRIDEVLEVMSFAEPEGTLRRPASPGDIVVLRVERQAAPEAPTPKAAAPGAPPERVLVQDPDSLAVTGLIESLHGLDPEIRAERMATWLKKNGKNRFADSVMEEMEALRRLAAERDARGPSGGTATPELGEPLAVHFDAPKSGFAGAPLELGIETSGDVRAVLIHSRHASEVAYVSTPMRSAGLNFWVGKLTADRVKAPAIEYFLEAVRADGTVALLVGGPGIPQRVETPEPPRPAPPIGHRSTASAYADYADYNFGKSNDRLWQIEGFFGMRFEDVGMRSLRTGFGVYRGEGGSIEELDVLKLRPRAVGLTYGYLEGEFGLNHTVSLIGRLVVGLGEDGVTGGAQAHVRIGNDLETNLLIGGEVLGGIGLRGIAQLELAPAGRFPVMVRTEVTNQPAGIAPSGQVLPTAPVTATGTSDLGGRVVLQAGYRVATPLVVFLRASGQGRTINHVGPGFGGGVTYEW